MIRVWKYPVRSVQASGRALIGLPEGSWPISVGLQDDEMFVWAVVPKPLAPNEPRVLIVLNTGQEYLPTAREMNFLGTVTTSGGIVWHVWDGLGG